MKKGEGKNNIDLLTTLLNKGYITLDEVVKGADEVTIMKKVLIDIHPYEIALQKDGRWTTYVEDKTRPSGRRLIKKSTEAKLYAALLDYYGISDKVDMTFADLFDEWRQYKCQFVGAANRSKALSQSTIRRYKRDYDKCIAGTKLDSMKIGLITPVKLEEALLEMIEKNKLPEKSASNILGYISQMFAYAVRAGHLRVNPYSQVDRVRILAKCPYSPPAPDDEKVYTIEEFKALYEVVRRSQKRNRRYTPNYAIELAMLTGMRAGEISALNWDCITDDCISIDRSEHRIDYDDRPCEYVIGEPKNGKHRKIPLTDDMRDVLRRVKMVGNPSPEGYIFTDKDGKRHTEHDIGCACGRRGETAGIEGEKSIQRARRTISSLLRDVMPVEAVSNLLGHTDEVNTRHYAFDTSEMALRRDALEKVIPFKRLA